MWRVQSQEWLQQLNTKKYPGREMNQNQPLLSIENLHVKVESKQILHGVNLQINKGEIHALMGRNGSGKSTLGYTLMGHPRYVVTQGSIHFKGVDLLNLPPDERAKKGMYLAFQYPVAIPGVSVSNFLRATVKVIRGQEVPVKEFRKEIREIMQHLDIKEDFLSRYVNDGFSGGEKKRLEILQMALFKPQLALLDETDSGLDIDALKTVASGIEAMAGPDISMLLITHYQRMLNYVIPQFVHVMHDGKIVASGGSELALKLESQGYESILKESEPAAVA
jgi:Fe-S cluster assembly ATP-binding protein